MQTKNKKHLAVAGALLILITGVLALPHIHWSKAMAETNDSVLENDWFEVTDFSVSDDNVMTGDTIELKATVMGKLATTSDSIVELAVYDDTDDAVRTATFPASILDEGVTTDFATTTMVDLPEGEYHAKVTIWNADRSGTLTSFTIGHFMINDDADNDSDQEDNDSSASTTEDRIDFLREHIADYQAQINEWQDELDSLVTQGNEDGNTEPDTAPSADTTITPSDITIPPGAHIDFNGRNFGREENITILRNNLEMGYAHADGGGNFSTGSMIVEVAPGHYTYTFKGDDSGISVMAHVTVEP